MAIRFSAADPLLDHGRYVPMRFIHILCCPVEEIKIDEGCRLQCVVGAFCVHVTMGKASEFLLDERG